MRVHLRTKEQKREALAKKIMEEAMEAGVSGSVSELADLQEAVDRLVANEGLTSDDVRRAQEDKRARLGGFDNCYFIEEVRLPADNTWVEYYAGNSDRFPEV